MKERQYFSVKNIVDKKGVPIPRVWDIDALCNPDDPMTRIAPSENLPSEIDFDTKDTVLKCRGVIKDADGNIHPYGYVTIF